MSHTSIAGLVLLVASDHVQAVLPREGMLGLVQLCDAIFWRLLHMITVFSADVVNRINSTLLVCIQLFQNRAPGTVRSRHQSIHQSSLLLCPHTLTSTTSASLCRAAQPTCGNENGTAPEHI